jgi:acetyl coenzyme A synthetase (ADP forming)-like protein
MKSFFSPSTVAIVGASATPGKIGYEIVKNIKESHKGTIFPVNPAQSNILGWKCYPQISSIPQPVDLAIVVVPPRVSVSVLEECGQKKITSVVVVSGGFRESGNSQLQEKLVTIAKKYDMRIIGPNCIGIFNGVTGLNTFFQTQIDLPGPGKVSIMTQSGALGISLLEWLAHARVGISKFVSFGNKADIDEIDVLNFLKSDPHTHIVGIYMEWLAKGPEFLEMIKKITRNKPVVILKAGKTQLGAQVAQSHTGSMSRDDRVFSGAMRQAGCLEAESYEELFDILQILSKQPLPRGGRIGFVTNGAGPCVLAADHIQYSRFLSLAQFQKNTLSDLKRKLPGFSLVSNPLDLTGSATAQHYRVVLSRLAEDSNVDILMPFFVFQDTPLVNTLDQLYESLKELQDYSKPIIVVSTGGHFTECQGERLAGIGIPQIQDPSRAIGALDKILGYHHWKTRH